MALRDAGEAASVGETGVGGQGSGEARVTGKGVPSALCGTSGNGSSSGLAWESTRTVQRESRRDGGRRMATHTGSSPEQAPSYRVGDVVNGHVFTGVAWVPVGHATSEFGTPAPGGSRAEPFRPGPPVSAGKPRLRNSQVQPEYAGAPVKPGMALSTKVALAVLGLVVGFFALGIAAAVAIPVFLNSSDRGYEAAVKSDLRDAATAAETYWAMSGTPPVDAQVLDDYGWFPATGVTIMLAASGPGGYCLEGQHANLPGQVWSYASDTGLAEGACF